MSSQDSTNELQLTQFAQLQAAMHCPLVAGISFHGFERDERGFVLLDYKQGLLMADSIPLTFMHPLIQPCIRCEYIAYSDRQSRLSCLPSWGDKLISSFYDQLETNLDAYFPLVESVCVAVSPLGVILQRISYDHPSLLLPKPARDKLQASQWEEASSTFVSEGPIGATISLA